MQNTDSNIQYGAITVLFHPKLNALYLPYLNNEVSIEVVVSPSAILALSDSKYPSDLVTKGDKAIIEHILVARNIAYKIKSLKAVKHNDDYITYEVQIALPQCGNEPLYFGNLLLVNRNCAQGVHAITLVDRNAPHYYRHLDYGQRPDTIESLKKFLKSF